MSDARSGRHSARAWIESEHVSRIGLASVPDWRLVRFALGSDYAFVTNNARDFRRLYKRIEVHPGLLIIIPQGRSARQMELFRAMLAYLENHSDIVNQLVEIDGGGIVTVTPWSKVIL